MDTDSGTTREAKLRLRGWCVGIASSTTASVLEHRRRARQALELCP